MLYSAFHLPQCPLNAIYAQEDLPGDQKSFVALNAKFARQWPSISVQKDPLPTAEEFKDVKEKLALLEP